MNYEKQRKKKYKKKRITKTKQKLNETLSRQMKSFLTGNTMDVKIGWQVPSANTSRKQVTRWSALDFQVDEMDFELRCTSLRITELVSYFVGRSTCLLGPVKKQKCREGREGRKDRKGGWKKIQINKTLN